MHEQPLETTTSNTSVASDLIVGMAEIARELGVTKRKASYWHERGSLPTFKMGGTVCARRSELDAALRANPERAGR